MGQEIDLLKNYPRAKRDIAARGEEKTPQDRAIARQFGKEFFDGERRHGYGGYQYNKRFWQPVVPTFQQHYQLAPEHTLLDIGCGKGFMLHDFCQLIPGLSIHGIDISSYAINQALPDIKPQLSIATADQLPFADNQFDLAISINTLHNLDEAACKRALAEIQRVSRHSFITVDAYKTELEKQQMFAWNLTAQTIFHVEAWQAFFQQAGYDGDYYWFTP